MKRDHLDDADFIALAYDTVGDAALWPKLLERILAVTASDALIQISADASPSAVYGSTLTAKNCVLGVDAEAGRLYGELAYRSPIAKKVIASPPGCVIPIYSLISEDDFARTEISEAWVRPQRMADAIFQPLTPTGPNASVLTIMREASSAKKPFLREKLARSRLAHVSRAFQLNQRLVLAGLLPSGIGAEMLNSVRSGMVCAGPDGRVVWMNDVARHILIGADGLALDNKSRLTTSFASQKVGLETLISQAHAGYGGALSLPRPSGRMPLCVTTLVLGEQRSETLAALLGPVCRSLCLLVIHDPEATLTEDESNGLCRQLRTLYDLTAMEATVAAVVARGGGLSTTAAALGVSYSTVHTHTGRIFQKMQAHSQSDVVRLVERLLRFRTAPAVSSND